MKLTRLALKRPVTAAVIVLAFIVVGAITAPMLPLEFFPNVEFPFIYVYVPYEDANPEIIEREITKPIEEVVATLGGIKRIRSRSNGKRGEILVEFEWGCNATLKAIEAREKIDAIRNDLPKDVDRIYIGKESASDWAVLSYRISGERDLSDAYEMLNRLVKRPIERLPGVSKVELYGTQKRLIQIELIADRLKTHSIDLIALSNTLSDFNFQLTAGRITVGSRQLVVRPMGRVHTVEEIGNLIVDGDSLRLRDIAHITHKMPKLDYGRHLDGKYAIGLEIFKESGANMVAVSRAVKAEIGKIAARPEMSGISIFIMDDMAQGVLDSLWELAKAGLLGFSLSIIILYIFLRQWSSTMIVAMAVPFSIFVTLVCMYFLNLSLNILTMTGLLLAVGMVVDNSVVVTENIFRKKRTNSYTDSAVATAAGEVGLAITAGTFTTVIVFLPNIIGENSIITFYLKHVGLAFAIALITSLVIAQTMVPLITARIDNGQTQKGAPWIAKLTTRYRRLLTWLIRHRVVAVGIVVGLLVSVLIPAKFVKNEMFSSSEDRRLRLRYHINETYTLEKVKEAVNKIETYLLAHKEAFEIDSVYSYFDPGYAQTKINLTRGDRAHKAQEEIEKKILAGLPELAIAQPDFKRKSSSGTDENFYLRINGATFEQLIPIAREIAWVLQQIPGLGAIRPDVTAGENEVRVVVNRQRARNLGLSPEDISRNVSIAMRGHKLTSIQDETGETEVRVVFQGDDRRNLQDLENLTIFKGDGQSLRLDNLAHLAVAQGPAEIRREGRRTSLGITIDKGDLTVAEAKKSIKKVLHKYRFAPGVSWDWGRSFDFEDETQKTMMTNTLLALAMIYLVMAALFESLFFPIAIWVSIVYAVVGVYWFFLITGTTFDFLAWTGVLVLIGVVVNNGIVLIDHLNQLRARGMARNAAIVRAGCDRLRPILMTAGTTVLSMVPLCFSTSQIGGDGPPYFPLARAIVGGLLLSTFVTLIILPTIYILVDELKRWITRVVGLALESVDTGGAPAVALGRGKELGDR